MRLDYQILQKSPNPLVLLAGYALAVKFMDHCVEKEKRRICNFLGIFRPNLHFFSVEDGSHEFTCPDNNETKN